MRKEKGKSLAYICTNLIFHWKISLVKRRKGKKKKKKFRLLTERAQHPRQNSAYCLEKDLREHRLAPSLLYVYVYTDFAIFSILTRRRVARNTTTHCGRTQSRHQSREWESYKDTQSTGERRTRDFRLSAANICQRWMGIPPQGTAEPPSVWTLYS